MEYMLADKEAYDVVGWVGRPMKSYIVSNDGIPGLVAIDLLSWNEDTK